MSLLTVCSTSPAYISEVTFCSLYFPVFPLFYMQVSCALLYKHNILICVCVKKENICEFAGWCSEKQAVVLFAAAISAVVVSAAE